MISKVIRLLQAFSNAIRQKFVHDFSRFQLAGQSTNLKMTKCSLSGRGQGHVAQSRISHPGNISGTAVPLHY